MTRLCSSLWMVLLPGLLVAQEPARKVPARFDVHGDPLPPSAVARLGSTRFWIDTHYDYRATIIFSTDGKTLVTIAATIDVMDAVTGKPLRRFENLGQPTREMPLDRLVVCSADGRTLAGFSGPTAPLKVWDTLTGKEIRRVGTAGQRPLAFSPDGKTLVTTAAKGLEIWDVSTGRKFPGFKDSDSVAPATLATFSANGKVLASREQDSSPVCLWDIARGKVLARADGPPQAVPIALSPNGKLLAVGSVLFDVTGRDLGATFGDPIYLAFSPNGKVLAASRKSGGIEICRVSDRTRLCSIERNHELPGQGLAFSHDGKLVASIAPNGTIDFWDADTGKTVTKRPSHLYALQTLTFSRDGQTITAIDKDVVLGHPQFRMGALRRWDFRSGRITTQIKDLEYRYVLSSDGQFLAESEGQVVETATGKRTQLRLRLFEQVAAWSADTKMIVSMVRPQGAKKPGLCQFLDPRNGKKLYSPIVIDQAGSVLLSPDSQKLLVWQDPHISDRSHSPRIWEISSGKEYPQLPRDPWRPTGFSSNGKVLVIQKGRTTNLWDITAGRQSRQLAIPQSYVACMSPDGKFLAASDFSDNVIVWELATGLRVAQLAGHRGFIRCLAFSPDNRLLVSGSSDTTALVWSLPELITGTVLERERLTTAELEKTWAILGNPEPSQGIGAMWRLVAAEEQAVPLLRQRLEPVASPDPVKLQHWITQMGDDAYNVRQKATQELERLAERAEPALRKAVAANPDLESRRRLEQLLLKLEAPLNDPKRLRPLRAVMVLEQIGNAEARQLLKRLSRGAAGALLTQEARGALQRLESGTRRD